MNNPAAFTAPAAQFDDVQQQQAASQLGMWIFLATEVLFFGVLFAAYTILRLRDPLAFAAASRHTDLFLGTIETAVLLTSGLTAALAVGCNRLGRRRATVALLLATAGLGLLFLGLHAIEYVDDFGRGLMPGISFSEQGPYAKGIALFYCLYLVMTGMHGLHVLAGVILLGVIAAMAQQGRIGPQYQTPLALAGLYWSFVDIVWLYLYPLIYLVARS